ncbi:winged helix-turn-helix transcriptional regulator [Sneathiella marina]|uniref:Winged helix-turn-helix transcriptional regulator n=1 Tax=Sneathiella marina TaxID=2950108 RepID=A0ABY4VZ77_9PROT|nr:winged helix-turn-helix transcriptional regulator [Sneathiella marina]USG60231.1 winged helix-turn-helix transcriptional regulator [Sneathiella marina]
MDINTLVKITSRAWSLNILALMDAGVPGRQAPLLSASNASRTAFTASLDHLTQLKLLERNPGHGHPLRPEYRLTLKGIEVAKIARRIVEADPDCADSDIIRKSWTVPVLAVTGKPQYFTEIKSKLFPITDRALSQSLFQLHGRDWLLRDVDSTKRPLRPTYQVSSVGVRINRAINFGR